MSSFMTRTEQKIKEWWGAPITKDPNLDVKKDRVNEIDQYIRGLTQAFSSLSSLFQQTHTNFANISQITARLYEKESGTNKRIGIEVSSIFANLSELYRSKVENTADLNKNFNEWFALIETLKVQLKSYHEVRLVYDHYKDKVNKIQVEHQALITKGSMEQHKISEKLRRNQSKLSSSESTYQAKLSEILNNMNKGLGVYFKQINTGIETFLATLSDVTSNAESIVRKNLDIYKQFKYPELEPIIDLVRSNKEAKDSMIVAKIDEQISKVSAYHDQQLQNRQQQFQQQSGFPDEQMSQSNRQQGQQGFQGFQGFQAQSQSQRSGNPFQDEFMQQSQQRSMYQQNPQNFNVQNQGGFNQQFPNIDDQMSQFMMDSNRQQRPSMQGVYQQGGHQQGFQFQQGFQQQYQQNNPFDQRQSFQQQNPFNQQDEKLYYSQVRPNQFVYQPQSNVFQDYPNTPNPNQRNNNPFF